MKKSTIVITILISVLLIILAEAGPKYSSPSKTKSKRKVTAKGVTGKTLAKHKSDTRKNSGYRTWKRRLPFWQRKFIIFAELIVFISIGVIIGQILEVSGIIRWLSFITFPLQKGGDLPECTSAPFLMSLQSGAVANSMLAGFFNEGELSKRQLYTAVLVVSCLSLFAHLPTFIMPLAMAFGKRAALLFFTVRIGAIIVEIATLLLISNFIIKKITGDKVIEIPQDERLGKVRGREKSEQPFFKLVWKRSARTLIRLAVFIVPSFAIMASLERSGAFSWLADNLPGLFSLKFLPAESAVIIPSQAISLYNGAITAGNFIDEGTISAYQAVIILLCGSLITSPFRTLKHALPTYIAIFGPKVGSTLAISAQVLRIIFVGSATAVAIVLM